jgi:1-deoxy-D-xylulose-5-phosphate reductoisomerase
MCVQYAVDYPCRMPAHTDALDLFKIGKLTFARPDTEAFPLLALAARAIGEGGALPAVMNAADEVAVGAFLNEKISFSEISEVVMRVYDRMSESRFALSLEDIIASDRRARAYADEIIKEIAR